MVSFRRFSCQEVSPGSCLNFHSGTSFFICVELFSNISWEKIRFISIWASNIIYFTGEEKPCFFTLTSGTSTPYIPTLCMFTLRTSTTAFTWVMHSHVLHARTLHAHAVCSMFYRRVISDVPKRFSVDYQQCANSITGVGILLKIYGSTPTAAIDTTETCRQSL